MTKKSGEPKKRVLLVDDDANFIGELKIYFENEYDVRWCPSPTDAIGIYQTGWPDLVLLDIEMDEMDGLTALKQMKAYDADTPIIMLTIHKDTNLVVQAMKAGAYHFMQKDQDPSLLLETMEGAFRYSSTTKQCLYYGSKLEEIRGTKGGFIFGPSPASKKLLDHIEKAAGTDAGVLIIGESATGKELLSKLIHQKSDRRDGPFIPLDVASIPDDLVASEIFGHEKGAFTGADSRKIGAFEAANGGTIFLDEIGNIPIDIQNKLLRLLQEKSFRRLGGFKDAEIHTDTRIITATNKNLTQMVADGEFKNDLYHRLNILRIDVPPLRERLEDIPELVQHFLNKHNVDMGTQVAGVSEDALRACKEYKWIGNNIRELENAIIRAIIYSDNNFIELEDINKIIMNVDKHTKQPSEFISGRFSADPNEPLLPYAQAKNRLFLEFKRSYLSSVLEKANGVVNQAARLAGLPQSSFRKMLREAGIRNSDNHSDS